ncbi:MAG: hypothetical protein KAI66_11640, partial [Lentisphaeria bacterium]|nr:hypothetical protein [Lentisphaeria bacterium]
MFTFDRIRAYHIRFPMRKPFRISVGEIREKECLLMLEQPLDEDDLYYHSLLRERIETPVCMDESIKNLHLTDCA